MNIDIDYNIGYSKPLNIKSSKYRYNKLIKYKHYSLKLCSLMTGGGGCKSRAKLKFLNFTSHL